jgi:hypothetical protein
MTPSEIRQAIRILAGMGITPADLYAARQTLRLVRP